MWRDIYLEITKSVSRYLAIVAIVALGVGFLYGVKVTPQAMRYTADRYFDGQHYSDFRVVSSVGFSEMDAEQIEKQPYVFAVEATSSLDLLIESPQGLKPVRLHAVVE